MGDQTQVNSGNNSSALISDPIFSSVHDAFQLGWSIIELKSRIQIAALSTSITGTPRTGSMIAPANANQGQRSKLLQNVLTTVSDAKTKLLVPESQQNLTALPDNAWLTSLWRATFNRIVESHKGCFPKSNTMGTLYNLPPQSNTPSYQALATNPRAYDASNMYLPYLYLHPGNELDYADVGIQNQTDNQLTDFTLYDATRRAINCLTLLYTDPKASLTPATVSDFQGRLVQNVTNFRMFAASINNSTQSAPPQADSTPLNQQSTPQAGNPPSGQLGTATGDLAAQSFDQQRADAIQLVSNQSIRFLETWDMYARETLYVTGGEDAQTNEIQLVAYEAGRAMASLSWGITTTIVPIENALNQTMNMDASTSQDAKNDPGLQRHLEEAWLKIFDENSIASLQMRISALSTAMDNAYYRTHPNVAHPNPNDQDERTNLALPSQTIQAVTFSLDYWKRAVQLICNRQPDTSNGTPLTGSTSRPVTIPSMTPQTSSQLRLALVQQAQIWQPLLLHQQSLLDFTTQYVTQRIVNDFMSAFETATSKEIQDQIKRYRVPLILGGGVILLLLGLFVLLLVLVPSLSQALVSGFALVVGGIVGFIGTSFGRLSSLFSPAPLSATVAPERASSISAIPGLAGAALAEAFQNGYKQILVEFDYLNHNVSITYPLVEYFILHSEQLAMSKASNTQAGTPIGKSASGSIGGNAAIEAEDLITDAYDFLTQIAWTNQDRADEIERIARAAFGPIGAFIGAQLSLSSDQNNASPKTKK